MLFWFGFVFSSGFTMNIEMRALYTLSCKEFV